MVKDPIIKSPIKTDIPIKTLLVPLKFWFCRNYGLALPLIALQYHEVKLSVKLSPFNQCWKKEFIIKLFEVIMKML